MLPSALKLIDRQISRIDNTIKSVYQLQDKTLIESVLMFYDRRITLCISSQVGCAMNCDFCATGRLGLIRNLTAYEILEQIRDANNLLQTSPYKNTIDKITNIVFMGMGEPTQNLDEVFMALELIVDRSGFGISPKNITISTVGDVEGVKKLAKSPHHFKLAISLHAATDVVREKIMPINRKYKIADLIAVAKKYYDYKKSRVSFEWALMKNINDSEKQAYTLAKLINRMGSSWAHVNIIELNEIEDSKYQPSDQNQKDEFIKILKQKGINVTVRDSRGSDIDGACGQLAAKNVKEM